MELPEPERYTGHCFRRTSASLFVDGGGDTTNLKRHTGHICNAVTFGSGRLHPKLYSKQKKNWRDNNTIHKRKITRFDKKHGEDTYRSKIDHDKPSISTRIKR